MIYGKQYIRAQQRAAYERITGRYDFDELYSR